MPALDTRHWPTPKEAAAKLNKSLPTVIHWVDAGRLAGVIVGGKKRRRMKIDPDSLARLLSSN